MSPDPQQFNSLLNELKLLQQIPRSWRKPLIGLGIAVVVLLAWIVVAVRSELPPDMTPQQKQEQHDIETATAKKVVPKNADEVTQLFNPTIPQASEEQRKTAAAEQIDNILITMFVLYHCEMLKQEEYQDTYQVLVTYARYQKLASTLKEADDYVRQRASADSASYSLVYGQHVCERRDLKLMYANLTHWREGMRLISVKRI